MMQRTRILTNPQFWEFDRPHHLDQMPRQSQNQIQNLVGEKVYPSYSYLRIYKNGSELKRHKDRASCEITVSLCLGNDGIDWPLSFATEKGIEHLVLDPGDAIFYDGRKIEHWRDPFEGKLQAQVFLHYVTIEDNKFDI